MSFGFDPSLILAGKQYTGPDANDTMRTLAELSGRRVQQQQAEASLADMLRKQQQGQALADILRQNADNPNAVGPALMRQGLGEQAQDWMGRQADVGARHAQAQKAMQETIRQRGELLARPLRGGLKTQADLDQAWSAWRAAGLSDVELHGIPTKLDEQSAPLFEKIRAMGLSGEDAQKADLQTAQLTATATEAEKRRAFERTEKEKDRRNRTTNAGILAGQKAEERQAEEDRKVADDKRKASVQGFEILEDAYPTTDDAKKLKAALNSGSKIKKFTKELRELHTKHGTEAVGGVATRMKQLEKIGRAHV